MIIRKQELASNFMRWLAYRLPRRLVYSCAIRLMTHATTGKYSNTVVPNLTVLEALRRWEGS